MFPHRLLPKPALLLFLLVFCGTIACAQTQSWSYADPATDSIAGISLDKAYELLKGRIAKTVIVAVIDNGFDINHEDLQAVIWTNKKEIPGNGIDDDHNGYVDDIHGWNFRSTKEGVLVPDEQAGYTQLYADWINKYRGKQPDSLLNPLYFAAQQAYLAKIRSGQDSNDVKYACNLTYNSSSLLGDKREGPYDHVYGSPIIPAVAALSHGTHVAGIIGAVRDNGKGINGVADHVLIMPIVATTQTGDERDKDIANAIRYAVDNGAQLINMSFSKTFSSHKKVVDEAVEYAAAHGVLIFHAAGNDGMNDDSIPYYPVATYMDGRKAPNFITVGWSRSKFDYRLAHPYSNYGKSKVDFFAPGSDILSTVPVNSYGSKSGSSMSTPCATGIAALLLAYFPELSGEQVKDIMMRSVFKPANMVNRPGTKESVTFDQLCVSGGIINACNAVKMAIELTHSH
ncbi:MAG: S8 family peptidase [Chitinophaga sp.]|uniref:S8 family peptidase n=1 Tax=Chitinophaga sp. TaxID=1869181 RepID=UPI0025C711E6|nr:S8 family peptidase [Chitinophaga sp.]MBV8251558.1 S8 family peptidase [Chitinophaga sp.]